MPQHTAAEKKKNAKAKEAKKKTAKKGSLEDTKNKIKARKAMLDGI